MVMPRKAHTDIGESEKPGGMRVYCSASARTDNSQGLFPNDFWKKVTYKTGTGKRAENTSTHGRIKKGFSQLNDNDGGGQYDSSGGAGGKGNPQGSVCTGYKHYVQLVEPNDGRACIRCCQDYNDCPLDKDTAGVLRSFQELTEIKPRLAPRLRDRLGFTRLYGHILGFHEFDNGLCYGRLLNIV
ncbi:hypothetical protein RHS01_04500 [Rhizoctonia solani]|uniref:Uncharacterized protein n=1 Tax=Rhizoctonia solani TaxID=456999 RepID=A0A8H7M2S0_9AGAM|nr:hypothetical protein RHS01_04500 [Rhizoctonia solani]